MRKVIDRPSVRELLGMLKLENGAQVARRFGVTRALVSLWCKEYGFSIRDVRPKRECKCERCGGKAEKLRKYCPGCWERIREQRKTSWKHGTTNGYNNHGCRCDRCRKANTESCRRRARRRRMSEDAKKAASLAA